MRQSCLSLGMLVWCRVHFNRLLMYNSLSFSVHMATGRSFIFWAVSLTGVFPSCLPISSLCYRCHDFSFPCPPCPPDPGICTHSHNAADTNMPACNTQFSWPMALNKQNPWGLAWVSLIQFYMWHLCENSRVRKHERNQCEAKHDQDVAREKRWRIAWNVRNSSFRWLLQLWCGRSMHMKGSKECYILGQKHNLQIFGVISFVKLQNNT